LLALHGFRNALRGRGGFIVPAFRLLRHIQDPLQQSPARCLRWRRGFGTAPRPTDESRRDGASTGGMRMG
jgi:hypothetical protein